MLLFSLLFLLTTFLAACGGGNSTSNQKATTLTVGNVGDEYVNNFNPYAGGSGGPPGDLIYESLLSTNLANSTINAWLATSYAFSDNSQTLTFTLRDNVKWNDGQPFSADDVAFTFNLMHQYPGIDVSAIWKYISSVTATDPHTVTIKFKQVFTPMIWYLGRLQILPKHIWESAGDPSKYVDTKAIGTGPFKVQTFTPQMVTLQKNPDYWQPGKPSFEFVHYPVYKSNDTLLLELISDKVDYASIYAPNLDRTFIQKDPTNHHYWLVPDHTVMFYPNQKKAPFNQLAVRQAISVALDRDKMSKVAEQGYEKVANPTALILPNAKDYLDPQYSSTTFGPADPDKAKQILQSAGYTLQNGIFTDKNGKKLSFKINVPSTYSDQVLLCNIAADNLKAAGMDVSVNTLSYSDWYTNKQMGNYDITIDNDGGGLNPFYYYNRTLNSQRSAPIGKNAQSDFTRWEDPNTDKLLNQFASTDDKTVQKQAMMGIEKIFVEQLPTIPLLDAPNFFEYNSKHFIGWPSDKDPYTTPAASEQITLHLQSK